ncbi:MAG: hypothetical protein FJY85_01595, partial [Deltaproteobacteria bacterium]|nr:hypothetical protein [Deltaproteobacteria bacterium]
AAGFEWKTRIGFLGIPLVCIAFGRDERGKARVAKGFIALGQFAVGGIAISQFGVGIVSVGQFVLGIAALGQLAIGWLTGIGQLAVGTFAVGQFVIGEYGMGQAGWARYLWSPGRTDLEAVAMFEAVKWLFQQEPATVIDAIKFGLKLGKNWVLSVFN